MDSGAPTGGTPEADDPFFNGDVTDESVYADSGMGGTGRAIGRRVLGALRDSSGRSDRRTAIDTEKVARLLQQRQFPVANAILGGVDRAVQNAGTGNKRAEGAFKSPVIGMNYRFHGVSKEESRPQKKDTGTEVHGLTVSSGTQAVDAGNDLLDRANAAVGSAYGPQRPKNDPEDLGFGVNDEQSKFKDPFDSSLSYGN